MELLKRVFTGEIKGIDEKERTLTAYVSTEARDRMDERLLVSGADITKFKKNPVVLFAHNYAQPPIGKALWTKKDDRGVISKVQFAKTALAEEVFQLYKDGFMNAFSVGFIPKEWTDGDGEKTPSRTYNKWEMIEFSAVPVPANPEALTLAVQKGILKDETLKKSFGLDKKEEAPAEEAETKEYKCECIDCGHKETTEKHCKDIKCSECGGTMRRVERPGPGQASSEAQGPDENGESTKEEKPELYGDMLAQIKILEEKVEETQDENARLRLELYRACVTPIKKNTLSEIADGDLAKMVGEITVGVIRQAQGKID